MTHSEIRAYEYQKVLDQLNEKKPTTSTVFWEALFTQLWKDFDKLMKQKALFVINAFNDKDLLELPPKEAEKIIKQKKKIEHELRVMDATKKAIEEMKNAYLDTSTGINEQFLIVHQLFCHEYEEARKNATFCYSQLLNEYQNTAFWIEQYEKQLNENQKLRQQIQNIKTV